MNGIQNQIEYLSSMEQPAQRTEEWYKFRNGIITASNAYKVFESQSVVNQIIYEKCVPLKTDTNANAKTSVNINTPFHWGQKYEPVSLQIYEHTYKTKVADFGCIQHSKYSYLGASPDGINVDTSNPERFGRMLEIKNIVNREITGIPKKEYWVQMQMQMETCDLDECDFLETKFVEYDTETEFIQDRCETLDQSQFYKTREDEWKGIILYFSKDGVPYYIYKPLLMEKDEYEIWSEKQIEEQEKEGRMWVRVIYWNLKTFSCVFVPRNKIWFERNRHVFENVWKIIEKDV
jgi:putative phage-type endonuclease